MAGIREKNIGMLLEEIGKNLKSDCDASYSVDNFRKFVDALAMESELLGAHGSKVGVDTSTGINTAKQQDPIANLIIFNDDIYSWENHGLSLKPLHLPYGSVKRLSNNKWETVAIFDAGIEKVATFFFGDLYVSTIKTENQPSKVYRSLDGDTWELQQADAEVDESAKQQAEAANKFAKEIGALFLQPGDHKKELDEIFAKIAKGTSDSFSVFKASATPLMAESMTAKVAESENEANLLPVKGQEFHIYTGKPPSALSKLPEGILLCKAIFGDTVTIRGSGKASYGLLVKDNQYVGCIEIDIIPDEGKMCVDSLELYQGNLFTIDNW